MMLPGLFLGSTVQLVSLVGNRVTVQLPISQLPISVVEHFELFAIRGFHLLSTI